MCCPFKPLEITDWRDQLCSKRGQDVTHAEQLLHSRPTLLYLMLILVLLLLILLLSLKISPPAAAESCGGGQLSLCVAPLQQEGKPKNLDHLGDHHLNTVTVDGMDRCGIICCSLQGNEALSSSSVDTGYLSRGELSPGSPSCSSGWTRKRIIIMKWGGC